MSDEDFLSVAMQKPELALAAAAVALRNMAPGSSVDAGLCAAAMQAVRASTPQYEEGDSHLPPDDGYGRQQQGGGRGGGRQRPRWNVPEDPDQRRGGGGEE